MTFMSVISVSQLLTTAMKGTQTSSLDGLEFVTRIT